ncbi:MAG: HNH endonuclease [Syntrophobacterales bacterium]|nr:HNH endonuclease [Syntrophobacterales bacterium]
MMENYFVVNVSPEFVKREKEKAKSLRKTRWWQRKISKGQCYYCGTIVEPGELTMDHVVPIIRGGRSTKSNIVPACKSCNSKKKYWLPFEWNDYWSRFEGKKVQEDESS